MPEVVYALITLSVLASYFYFLFFKKALHQKDPELNHIDNSIMLNRASKEWWVWATAPVERYLIRKQIHPATLGRASVLFSLLACVGYSFGWFVLAGYSVLLAGSCDMLDGRLARKQHLTTLSGAFLDSNLDRWTESLWYLGLLNYYTNTPMFYVVFIAFVSSFMVSYAKGRAEGMGVQAKVGIMQRTERIVWLSAASVLSPLFSYLTNYLIPVSTTFLASLAITLIAGMTSYTYYERFKMITRDLNGRRQNETQK